MPQGKTVHELFTTDKPACAEVAWQFPRPKPFGDTLGDIETETLRI